MTGTVTEEILRIPLDSIVPSPGNRRIGGFNPERLEQLADSIRAVGVQQPAVVRPGEDDHTFELVAGERRWRASRLAGLDDLPCVVRELEDIQVLKIQTIENLQREDIHPLDEAEGYQRLIEKADYDVELIAQEVGRSPSYVYQRLKLRELIEDAKLALAEGTITAGHAIQIARLQPDQQAECMEYCVTRWQGDAPSVRELGAWIEQQILMDLHAAGFKKDDADLVPEAGSCTDCPKRTGYQPALFADVCKHDYCTDRDCFHEKIEALVARRREELKGEKHFEVCDGHLQYDAERKLPDRVLRPYTWQECKKKDDDSQRCLVVAGSRKGQIIWGMKRKSDRYGRAEKTLEEKAAEKEERAAEKKQRELMRKIWDATMENIEGFIFEEGCLPVHLFRAGVSAFYRRLWDEHRKRLCQLHGWERPEAKDGQSRWDRPGWADVGTAEIEDMGTDDLFRFFAECSLIHCLDSPGGYIDDEDENGLCVLGRSLGVDVNEIEAAAAEQTA